MMQPTMIPIKGDHIRKAGGARNTRTATTATATTATMGAPEGATCSGTSVSIW